MLVEIAVRCSISPISRAMLENRWLMSSSSTAACRCEWAEPVLLTGLLPPSPDSHSTVSEGTDAPSGGNDQGTVFLLDQAGPTTSAPAAISETSYRATSCHDPSRKQR